MQARSHSRSGLAGTPANAELSNSRAAASANAAAARCAHSMLAAVRDDLMEPQHFARQAALARPRQKAADPSTVSGIAWPRACVSRSVRLPSQRSPSISLPYRANVATEVQNIVGDLERQPEQIAETIEPVEVLIVAVGDERADPHRVNEAVPGRLLQHEPQVVVRPDREIVVAHPAELHGLPLQGLDDHVIDFVEDAQRRHRSEPLAGLAEEAHGERVHGIAGVHGNWNPGAAMHCRDAAPRVAAVFNIVVHEKCVVQHFQAGGGGKQRRLPPYVWSRPLSLAARCMARSFEVLARRSVGDDGGLVMASLTGSAAAFACVYSAMAR